MISLSLSLSLDWGLFSYPALHGMQRPKGRQWQILWTKDEGDSWRTQLGSWLKYTITKEEMGHMHSRTSGGAASDGPIRRSNAMQAKPRQDLCHVAPHHTASRPQTIWWVPSDTAAASCSRAFPSPMGFCHIGNFLPELQYTHSFLSAGIYLAHCIVLHLL